MTPVLTGADQVASGEIALPSKARLALLSNRAAQTLDGHWTADAVRARGYAIQLLLTPEHGLAAAAGAGEAVPHSSVDGVPILSMYGADPAPIAEALSQIEMLVIDLPDVGCRYYTYGWTLREALKLATRHTVPVIVLDRPNPLGGRSVEGNLPDHIDSPVCAAQVPVRHGLTLGELALWHRRALRLDVEISIVVVGGWQRAMLWPETGLSWVPPSPALRSPEAALTYPGTCLLEGTNISEGRGTDRPFLILGAPFLDGPALARALQEHPYLEGATVRPTQFVPSSSKWAAHRCEGVVLEIDDPGCFRPVRAGLAIVTKLSRIPGFAFRATHFDALAGTSSWRELIDTEGSAEDIAASWDAAEKRFADERNPVLLPEYGPSPC